MQVWVCLEQEEEPEAAFDSEEAAKAFCREKNLKHFPEWHGEGYLYYVKLTISFSLIKEFEEYLRPICSNCHDECIGIVKEQALKFLKDKMEAA
jgi:hypothetical protein